jgi:anti-sigma factor RsiW
MKSACESYQMLLSAYADGEVTSRERSQVEFHLEGCGDCRARLSDLRAFAAAMGSRLEQQAARADFSGFADEVLRRIGPGRPPLLERLRVLWSEILAYHRTAVISSLATAAITLLVAVPVVYNYALSQAPEVIVHDVQADDPDAKPVVMNLGDGKTLIMLVTKPDALDGDDEPTPDLTPEPATGGDL